MGLELGVFQISRDLVQVLARSGCLSYIDTAMSLIKALHSLLPHTQLPLHLLNQTPVIVLPHPIANNHAPMMCLVLFLPRQAPFNNPLPMQLLREHARRISQFSFGAWLLRGVG